MRRPLLLAFAALAAVTAAALPTAEATAQQRRAPAQDWTRIAARTPEGGFRMGNPAARLKLVEYVSLTCSHCATFAHEGNAGLMAAVRTGRVSIEYRNYFRDGLDISAALLTRCASPVNYFAMTHDLLGTQATWMGRVRTLTAEQRRQVEGLQPLQQAHRITALLGLDAIGQRYGITPALRQRCMNQAGLDQLQQMRATAEQMGVRGTPTFFINGVIQDVNTWAGIGPLLG